MRAISSMATRHLLTDLFDLAQDARFPLVDLDAVGGVVAADRVASGESFDLVVLAEGALRKLADAGHVDASSITPIVVSRVAVAVAADSALVPLRPDGVAFADADGLRAALRAAGRIGYSTGPSGTALVSMIDGWGMTDEIGDRLVQARAGVPVAHAVAEHEVDLGLQQLSELAGQPGVRVLGVLPADCAIDTVFAGAVATASADPVAARAVLDFLASPGTSSLRRAHHFSTPA